MMLKCLACGHINTDLEKKEFTEVFLCGRDTGGKLRVCNECKSASLVNFDDEATDKTPATGS